MHREAYDSEGVFGERLGHECPSDMHRGFGPRRQSFEILPDQFHNN